MEELLKSLEDLKNSDIKSIVNHRINEFKELGRKSSNDLFKELCFCILTANFNAERSIKIQKEIDKGFLYLPEEMLVEKLREFGHRYPFARARYIINARKYKDNLKEIICNLKGERLREWLVKHIAGLGYKEASHFLRNIGFDDFAIIDFHIVDILAKHDLIKKPKTITRKKYLEIEGILREIARKSNLTLAELDLYLWYMETGKVLK